MRQNQSLLARPKSLRVTRKKMMIEAMQMMLLVQMVVPAQMLP